MLQKQKGGRKTLQGREGELGGGKVWGRPERARTNMLKPTAFYADLKFEY